MLKGHYPDLDIYKVCSCREMQYQSDLYELQRNWKNIEYSYRQLYPNITDEDLKYRAGEFEALPQRIASMINRTRQEV